MNKEYEYIRNQVVSNALFSANRQIYPLAIHSFLGEIRIALTQILKHEVLIKRAYLTTEFLISSSLDHSIKNNNVHIMMTLNGYNLYVLFEITVSLTFKEYIRNEIDSINDNFKSNESFKEFYKMKLKDIPFTKGGKNMGFMDVARRSRNKILYSFSHNEIDCCIFSVISTISVAP